MADGQSPTVHQRRLRVELRKARERMGFTQEQVADALEWSLSKVIRIEAGSVGLSTTDLRALLQQYEVAGDQAEELVTLARAAREKTWWSGYKRVLHPDYLELIGYEAAASRLRQFELLIVPGLMQTAEYADAYISSLIDPDRRGNVDALVEVRVRRQEILERESSEFLFVLDEASVRRQIGGRQVMRPQLKRVIEFAEQPNITVEIVPFGAGAHFGLLGSFTIIEFPDAEDDDILHLESTRNSSFTRGLSEDIVRHKEALAELRTASLGANGSLTFLNNLTKEL